MKYNVRDLINRCNARLSLLSIIKGDFETAEGYIKKVTPGFNKLYYYVMFNIVARKKDDNKFIELYDKYNSLEWVQKSEKTKLFFELFKMQYHDKYMNKKRYEKNLKRLIKLVLKADDGEMIEISCNVLMDFLRKERRYKLAFEVAQTLLHYNKNGI
jgi:hypothetical protein